MPDLIIPESSISLDDRPPRLLDRCLKTIEGEAIASPSRTNAGVPSIYSCDRSLDKSDDRKPLLQTDRL